MKILPWLGITMIAVCIGADAQSIQKCVGKDGKTSYSSEPCPGSKEIEVSSPPRSPPPVVNRAAAKKDSSASPATSGASDIPEVQPGKWKLTITRRGRTSDNETCGDPIDGFRQEVQTYSANAKAKWGCTMTTNNTGPRNVNVVYDCPTDRSPDGRPVQKGHWELSMVSASPQAFRIEMKSTNDAPYVMEGTRIGDCVQGGSGPARTSTGGAWPKLPELRRGQWTVEDSAGPGGGSPICGHPLQRLYSEYDQLAKLREQGCAVDASSPRPGTVQASADCPADSKIGESKTTLIVVSPNPTYVSVQYTHKGRQQILSAKRSGDC